MGLTGWNSPSGEPAQPSVKEKPPPAAKEAVDSVKQALNGQSENVRMSMTDFVFIVGFATYFGMKVNAGDALVGAISGYVIGCFIIGLWIVICEDLL